MGLLYKNSGVFDEWLDMEGENLSGLFYGRGLAKDAGEYLPYMTKQFEREELIDNLISNGSAIEDASAWRFINYNFFENGTVGLMSNLLFEHRDEKAFASVKHDWVSVGVRPYWFIDKTTRLLLEAGYDGVDDKVEKENYPCSR